MKHFISTNLETFDDATDAVDGIALERFVAGIEPWARTVKLSRVRSDAPLAPDGQAPDLVAIQDNRTSRLYRGNGWTLLVVRWQDRSAALSVTAVSESVGEEVLEQAQKDALEPIPEIPTRVRATFTHLGDRGPQRVQRNLEIAPWDAVRRNYNGKAVCALDTLMAVGPETVTGRLLLMHGPPGTGKTTALRALADAWRRWCDLEIVIDPEQLMRRAGYLSSFMVGDDDEEDTDATRWRLILLEDCDDLIRNNAGANNGHALARLLNLTDGILGQGLRLLVAITTNEPIGNLHPAVTRPGRCIAEIEVGKLSAEDVAERMAALGQVPREMTLAELFALEGSCEPIAPPPRRDLPIGLYL